LDRGGEVLGKIFVNNRGLRIDESGVEVTFEHREDSSNGGRRAVFLERKGSPFESVRPKQPGTPCDHSDKATPFHLVLPRVSQAIFSA
jgi:hypothetical protein